MKKPVTRNVDALATTAVAGALNVDPNAARAAYYAQNPDGPPKAAKGGGGKVPVKVTKGETKPEAARKPGADASKPSGRGKGSAEVKPTSAAVKKAVAQPIAATPSVSAAKPAKLGKAATAMAERPSTGGYDFSSWPVGEGWPKPPGLVEIMAVRACAKVDPVCVAELTAACYLTPWADDIAITDVGFAVGQVFGSAGNPKRNVIRQNLRGLVTLVSDKSRKLDSLSGEGKAMAYAVVPTAAGLKLIEPYLASLKLKPAKHWLKAGR